MLVRLLVEVADGPRRDFCPPESLCDVFDAAHGNAGQIHLDQGFLYGSFSAAVALDDRCFERNSFELGHPQGDITCGCREVPLIVAGSVTFPLFVAGVALSVHKLVGFGIEHGIEGLFDTVFYKIFQFGVDKILVYLYNVIRHSSFLLRILCVVTQLYLMEWTMSFLYYKFAQLIIPYQMGTFPVNR